MNIQHTRTRQAGFTMIELIVILGILAATALPKFIDMNSDAKTAALKGVVGAAASAMSVNYAGCAVTQHVVTTLKCIKISNCNTVGSIVQGGALPAGYTSATSVLLGTGSTGSNGIEATCTITQTDGGATATFTGISAGN
jgi:MSHA pilin protein MshA